MDLEKAVLELQNPRMDPTSLIERLIAEEGDAASALLARLAVLQAGSKPPLEIALAPPHSMPRRVNFRLPLGIKSSVAKLATRRIVIALDALRAAAAVPRLIDLFARAPFDTKLCEAVGWALANVGEAALLPLFSFTRRRQIEAAARSLGIVTLGYIDDPRVPTILNHLWREYGLEAPRLALVALLGLTVCGSGEEAHMRALETEQLWRARGPGDHARTGTEFETAAELLRRAYKTIRNTESLPTWPSVVQMLGRR